MIRRNEAPPGYWENRVQEEITALEKILDYPEDKVIEGIQNLSGMYRKRATEDAVLLIAYMLYRQRTDVHTSVDTSISIDISDTMSATTESTKGTQNPKDLQRYF